MNCARCGGELKPTDRFCSACGAPRPPADESGAADPRFREVERQYVTLRQRYQSGELTQDQLQAAVQQLIFQDGQGQYWSLGTLDGQWYVYQANQWVRASPPSEPDQSGAQTMIGLPAAAIRAADPGPAAYQAAQAPAQPVAYQAAARPAAGLQTVGLGPRFVAALIDGLICGLLVVSVLGISMLGSMRPGSGPFAGLPFVGFLLVFAYSVCLEKVAGGTLGKLMLGLRVRTLAGQPISWGQSALRNVLRIVDSLPFLYLIGIILIATSDLNQRLGDRVAGTVVVRAR